MSAMRNRTELVATARRLVAGEIDLLSGVRLLCDLAGREDRDEYPLAFLCAVESETDAFAVITPANRALYSEEFFERQAAAQEEYFASARDEILEAARAVLAKYA